MLSFQKIELNIKRFIFLKYFYYFSIQIGVGSIIAHLIKGKYGVDSYILAQVFLASDIGIWFLI